MLKNVGFVGVALGVLAGIWLFFAIVIPLLSGTVLADNKFENGQVIEAEGIGRFKNGALSVVTYKPSSYEYFDSEWVFEQRGFSWMSVSVRSWKNNALKLAGRVRVEWKVKVGNRAYTGDYLRDHPEILAEAKELMALGRRRFKEAQQKLNR